MLRVPSPPIFAYYSSAFGDTARRFGHLSLKATLTDITVMSFTCFIRTAEYGIADLFMHARLRASSEGGGLCANEAVLATLSSKMRLNVLKRGLLSLTSNCAADQVAAPFAFALLSKVHWAAPDCVVWFLYDFVDAAIILVPE